MLIYGYLSRLFTDVGRFNEHGRMYGQRRGGKFHAPGKQVFFFLHFFKLQFLYEIFQEIWFSVAFFIRKRIAVEIELIHVCTRGRKTCIFYPFSSSSSEIDPFRTVVFLFADAKLYENKHACDAGGMGFHGLNGRSPHSFS